MTQNTQIQILLQAAPLLAKGQNTTTTTTWQRQKFNKNWLSLYQFRGWLQEIPEDPFSCKCYAQRA